MQEVAKQIVNEDLVEIRKEDQVWHGIITLAGDLAICCTGEFIHGGAGCGTYEIKVAQRGITCKDCVSVIKEWKSIRL